MKRRKEKVFRPLSPREKRILGARYAIGQKFMTLSQLAAKYGVTAGRIRQIQINALSRLMVHDKMAYLHPTRDKYEIRELLKPILLEGNEDKTHDNQANS